MASTLLQVMCLAFLSTQLAECYNSGTGLYQHLGSRKYGDGRRLSPEKAEETYKDIDDDFTFNDIEGNESIEETNQDDRQVHRQNNIRPNDLLTESKRSHPKNYLHTCHLCQLIKEDINKDTYVYCAPLEEGVGIEYECRLEKVMHTNDFFLQFCVPQITVPSSSPDYSCPRKNLLKST